MSLFDEYLEERKVQEEFGIPKEERISFEKFKGIKESIKRNSNLY